MIWSRLACLGLLALLLTAPRTVGAEPKRVLLLHSFGRDFAPFSTFSEILRTELVSQSSEPVDVFEVSLESARFRDTVWEEALVHYVLALFSGRPPDLVIPIGGPAVQFAQRHRQEIFPVTPMLIAGTDQRHVEPAMLTTNDVVVAVGHEPSWVVECIRELLPQTTNIVVVIGDSPLERYWLGELRAAFQRFTNQVDFAWLNELSFAEMLKRCAALPPRSAVFYVLLAVDAEGIPHREERALTRLHDVANVPIFGIWDSQLGRGVVGGPLMPYEDLGRNTARIALRLLQGEAPGNIRVPPLGPGVPQFDWRELRRWGISEARLPAGSVVRFRQVTFWGQYWRPVAGVVAFILLQTALIAGLVIHRANRRRGEEAAMLIADISSRFVHVPADEVDREIEDAQRKVCERLGLDLSALWQWTEETPRYFKMTHLYRPLGGPAVGERMDAQELFPWCLRRLQEGEAISVSSMEALPAEAARDREVWQHYGIKSNLTFPLSAGRQLVGALSFNTTREERSFPNEIVMRLQVVAQIFANALARKCADHELRASEERFRDIASNLPGVVYQYYARDNGQRGTYYVAGRAREVFGVDPEPLDTFPERFTACVAPEDRPRWMDSVAEAIRAVRPWDCEVRFIKPGGEAIYVWGFSQPQRRGGEVVFNGVLRDITDRKRLDLALAESEQRYRTLFEAAPEGIVLIGPDGCVRAANQAMARLYRYERAEELLGRYTPLFVAEQDRERSKKNLRDQMEGREVPARIYTLVRRDGSEFIGEVTAGPLRGPQGELQGYLCLTRDITEVRNAHEALRDFSARLIRAEEEERS